MGKARAKVVTVAARIWLHGAVSAIVALRKFLSIVLIMARYAYETGIIHRLHRFFKERFLNLCDFRALSGSQPAPDRVEHDDHRGKHDDRGEAGVDEALH